MARILRLLLPALVLLAVVTPSAHAQSPTVIHQFDGIEAGRPMAGLVEGLDGRLYGTTSVAGARGAVYRVNTDGSGFEVLHAFGDGSVADDGLSPSGGALARDASGVLYGTTVDGGVEGFGTLYRLDPRGATPTYTVLYSFAADTANPESGVLVGSDGWLYGTTGEGNVAQGTVYRLARDGSDFSVLYTFAITDNPRGTLIEGSDGVLYGTTRLGGAFDAGTVFRINRDGSGFLSLADLDGYVVVGVTEAPGPDGTPHLFGVEFTGAEPARQFGSIFRLRRDGTDFERIGTFFGSDRDGAHPWSPLVLGPDGRLYGTSYDTASGCTSVACGTLYRVGEQDNRPWGIHLFTLANGGHAIGAPVFGRDGALYGTTVNGGSTATGGSFGEGVIYRIGNVSSAPLVFTAPAGADEGGTVTYSLSLRNSTGMRLYEGTVSLTFSDGLQFVGGSSDNWSCQVTGNTGLCQWLTLLEPGEQSDVHTLTFTALPPYAIDCGNAQAPCVRAEALLQYTGAHVALSTPVSTYVNGFLNRPPVAVDDAARTSGAVPVRIRVVANDTDDDGDRVTVSDVVTLPRYGTVAINADGSVTYTPNSPLTAPDSFRYRIDDGHGATATAVVTVSPVATQPLRTLSALVDIGPVALGTVAAGRTWVLAENHLQGHVAFEALTPAEITTALAGTGYDPSRASSNPAAFRTSDWYTLDTPPNGQAGMVLVYYRGAGAIGSVSVARAVIWADTGDPVTTAIVVATTAEPTLAPRVAIADLATSNTLGAVVRIDVIANDVRQGPSHYAAMVATCSDFAANLYDGATCSTGLEGSIFFPSSVASDRRVTFTPSAAVTGVASFTYGFTEIDACTTDPTCLPVNPIYFAPVSVVYRDGRPVDLGVTLSVTPASVDAGQPVSVTATITNHSTDAATDVTLQGLAPLTSFTNLSVSTTQGQCPAAVVGQPLNCSLGSISPFESATVVLTGVPTGALLPPGDLSRTLSLAVVAFGADPDPVAANDRASATVTITNPQRPHAEIVSQRFEDGAGQPITTARVGDLVRYAFTVRNSSAVNATVSVATTLPTGLTLVPGAGGWPCTLAGDTVTCTATVNASESQSTAFTVAIGPGAVPPGAPGAPATATSQLTAPGDTDTTGHAGLATITVTPRVVEADLSVQVSASPAVVSVGQPTTFTLTVHNAGPDAATGVHVTAFDFLTGFHFTGSTTPAGWTCQPLVDDQPVSCSAATLASGAAPVISVTASPTLAVFTGVTGSPSIVANATVSATEADPGTVDNVAAATITVPRPPAAVTVSAVLTPEAAAIGEDAVYDIALTNTGLSDAANTTIVVDLPSEIATRAFTPTGLGLSACQFSPALASAGTRDLTITCRFVTLAAGSTGHIRLNARLAAAPAGGVATIPVVVESNSCTDVAPAMPGTQCAVATIAVQQSVTTLQTQLIRTGSSAPVRVGDLVTFVARLTNTGAFPARNIEATIQLPPELRIDGASPIFGPLTGCSYPGGLPTPGLRISCTLSNLRPGATVESPVEVRVLAMPSTPVAPIVFRAGSQDCVDLASAPGAQCDSVAAGPIVERATLTLRLALERQPTATGPTQLGEALVARATVTNTSAIAARDVRLRLAFPAALGVVGMGQMPALSGASFTPSLTRGILGTPDVTIDMTIGPPLAAGASTSVTVNLRALAIPASGLYEATLDAGSIDCVDLVPGGQVLCDVTTGSMPVTPTSIGTISTGVGNVTLTTGTGLFRSVEGLPSSEVPPPPAGVTFPHGAMAFEVYDVPVGGTITVLITTPGPTSGYWKVVGGSWRRYTGGTASGGRMVLTLTDGGNGDADGRADGIIVDPGALGVSAVPSGHMTDASGLVQVTRGVLVHDADSGRDLQTLTLRNTTRTAIDGPVSLVFEGLTPGVSLAQPAGVTQCAKSTGAPYVLVDVGSDERLTSRESVPVAVEFINPNNAAITYRTRVLAGDVCQTTTAPLP